MKVLFALFALMSCLELAIAEESKLKQQALFMFTGNQFNPKDLNEEIDSSNIKDHKSSIGVLGEYDLPIADLFYGGLRFGQTKADSNSINGINNSEISVATMGALLRIPVINTKIFTLDGIAEAGVVTLGKVTITESFNETKYSSTSGEYQRVGGSVGIGYDSFFLYAETGIESNKFRGFTKSGERTGDLPTVDLSGTYTAFGIKVAPGIVAKYFKK